MATTWRRLVSIGDSFTEGMVDEDPANPGGYLGWADRLAMALAERNPHLEYANLAIRGRLLADIVGPQLDAALALEPDLVSIVGGGNDILRPRVDVDQLARTLDQAVGRIRATGADVLLSTPVCPAGAPVISWTSGRVGSYAAHINTIARRHGAFLIDQWGMPVLHRAEVWASDRIHLSSRGHQIVALLALAALGVVGPDGAGSGVDGADLEARCERIAAGADAVPLDLASHARWAREYFGPWLGRRLRGRSSGDLIRSKRPAAVIVVPHGGVRS